MRAIEDIVKEMNEYGFSPDSIDQDIENLMDSIKSQIVSIDETMSPQQVNDAFRFLYESNKRYPLKGPLSISLSSSGGVVLSEGVIVTMKPDEVANKFTRNLNSNEPNAVRLNQLLSNIG
jgi:uncharacterized membrane-anchored protein